MTDKRLRRLRRTALLQLLIEQMEENERLSARLAEAETQLENRRIAIDEAGTIAEAALSLNNVFTSAQAAAAQYLENINAMHEECDRRCALREEQAQEQAQRIVAEAKVQAAQILAEAEDQVVRPARKPEQEPDARKQLEDRFDEVFAHMRRRNKK